ncbi:MAG: POTRA domain-containing protein [Candidatus Pseudobacter hemicellulosilyticus]|uniref:POTRA domain-containing protein n=1 Tax=Candidatus Pseudobacter hemicellulosilyticus TaxID=3121375 RepID=A0AAJ5WW68_9BACT|nr:MAG: POTRA domain-containing protein [Pseudobacter sp.]
MGKKVFGIHIVLFLLCGCCVLHAQSQPTDTLPGATSSPAYDRTQPTPFVVGNIYIEGNKKTKLYIVLRELPFKTGDSTYLPELVKGFEIARRQLFNTGLFNEVIVALKSFRGYTIDITIQLKERWYIFPLPYLKPVDRNLSEWSKQGYDLDRLNYGFKFTHYNFTGRNDKLRLWLITGYTKQVQFQYDQPYADKSLKHGYRIGLLYSSNKEVNYITRDNQQLFIDSLASGVKRWYGNIDYTYRPGLRTVHAVRLAVNSQTVDSQVLQLNPKFQGTQRNTITYPEFSYSINYVNVDYIHFPLTGFMGEASLLRRGLHADMNMWQLSGKAAKGWQLSKKWYFGWQGYGVLRLPFKQPYINQRLFGYGDLYLRGLERYVIDGVGAGLSRQTFRRELFRFNIPTFLKSKTHDRIPFRIYARTFGDLGYAYNKYSSGNSLENTWLTTGGFGVDVVTFYDFIFRFDYSFNQLGQKGLFLHIKNEF